MILLRKQALFHHYLLTYRNEWYTTYKWCLNNGATFISHDPFDISFFIAAQYTKIQFWKELCFWGLEEENGKSCLIALILPWITINYLDSNCQNFPPRGQMNTKEFSNDSLIDILELLFPFLFNQLKAQNQYMMRWCVVPSILYCR